MKLTQTIGDVTITVEGTEHEVNAWYEKYIHSQITCQPDECAIPIEPINEWIDWEATNSDAVPKGVLENAIVEYSLKGGYTSEQIAKLLNWAIMPDPKNTIVKYRVID